MNQELLETSIEDDEKLNINISGYEGPLDLLLELSKKQKVDITKVSILELAEQYLRFIDEKKDNLKLTADYLVMASFLAYLKSKMLLPEDNEDIQEIEEDLAKRLIHYNAIKIASLELESLPREGINFFVNKTKGDFFVSNKVVINVGLHDLINSYAIIYNKNKKLNLKIENDKLFSIENGLNWLKTIFDYNPNDWKEIIEFIPKNIQNIKMKKSAMISVILASLNMTKDGILELSQKRNFDKIFIKRGKNDDI